MSASPIKLDNPRVWRTYLGGKLLDAFHEKDGDDGHFPEEWIMSVTKARNPGHENEGSDGLSRTENGQTLRALIESDPEKYLDKPTADTGVLVKLLDSAERLGIQVHPNREKAKALFNSDYGKTECWYILGTRMIGGEKPCVYLGFKKGITKEKWRELFNKQDIPGMLSSLERFEVEPGDTILVEGGVPHAIGAGCFLCEIQEPTDYTIRTERKTPSSFMIDERLCHQGIGFEKMFDVFDYSEMSREEIIKKWHVKPKTTLECDGGRIVSRVGYDKTPYFALEEIEATGAMTLSATEKFYGLYVIGGSGKLAQADGETAIEKGDQLFVPSGASDITAIPEKNEKLRIMRFFGPDEKKH